MIIPRSGRFPIHSAAPRALLFFLLLTTLPIASAHAVFGSSDPAPDSQVDVGLTTITVTVTEDVILELSGLEVTDLQGNDWTDGPTEHGDADNVMTIRTRPLQDGIYVIGWKALSADTHTTRGQFLIASGNATLTTRSGASTDVTEPPGGGTRDAIGRATFYLGLIVVAGTPFFFLVIDRERPPGRIALLVVAALGLAGAIGAVVNLQGLAERTGVGLAAIAASRGGIYLALRSLFVALGALTLAIAAWTSPRRALLALASAFGLAALVSTSLGSHAASVSSAREITIAADAIHLLVASVWLGGVAGFLLASPGRDRATLAKLVVRFSHFAMWSVALILLTGAYASVRFVRSWDALWTERYGQLVLAKIALVLVLVGFGAFNQRVVHPHLLRERVTPSFFRRVVALEAGVMALVLLAAGTLATTSPPQDEVEVDRTPLVLELENKTDVTHVVLQISPNPVTIGVQTIRVYLHPLTAAPVPNSTIVQLKVWQDGEEEPETSFNPDKTGFGEWTTKAGHFTAPGTWHVKVLYQRPDEGFKKFTFDVPVALPGQPTGDTAP